MGEKDFTEKILEAYNDVFADILNVLLFGGKRVISPDDLEDQTPNSFYKADGKIRELERDVVKRWKKNNIRILTAQLQDSHLYYDIDMKRATAIIMGTESTGLTQQWRLAADAHIRIPMLGQIDSLNVSVSTAILLFEAVRQRQCAKLSQE